MIPDATKTSTPTNTRTATATPTRTLTPTRTFTSSPTNTFTNTPNPSRPDTIGTYKDGIWQLRFANMTGAPNIISNFGGAASDLPITGDWNGDSIDSIGVYRSDTGVFFLSNTNTAPQVNYNFVLGNPADTPLAGRWTADMTHDGAGVYRNSNGVLYLKKELTTGFSDFFAVMGNPGDIGIAGDWDSNGLDSIGVYRPSNMTWYMTNNSEPSGITFSDIGFVWDIGGSVPVVGDWNGDAITTVGYRAGTNFVLHSTLSSSGSDTVFAFGASGQLPIAGKWVSNSSPNPSVIIRNSGNGFTNTTESNSAD